MDVTEDSKYRLNVCLSKRDSGGVGVEGGSLLSLGKAVSWSVDAVPCVHSCHLAFRSWSPDRNLTPHYCFICIG